MDTYTRIVTARTFIDAEPASPGNHSVISQPGRAVVDAVPIRNTVVTSASPGHISSGRQRASASNMSAGITRPFVDAASVNRVAMPARPLTADAAHEAAEAAYIALLRGERARAAAGFAETLARSPSHPNAAAWSAELRGLRRRWRMEAYSFLRSDGAALVPADRPLLGGGQSGARIGYTVHPLADRPLELFARFNITQDWFAFDDGNAQAAFGAAWYPLGRKAPSISAERIVAGGRNSRNTWAGRIAGGAAHVANVKIPFDLSVYAEAGIAGLQRGDLFAGGQAYVLWPLMEANRTRATLGTGIWASVQDGGTTSLSRLELGPSAQMTHRIGDGAIELRAEYRVRVAGNVEPGSGPSLTLATRF